MTNSTIAGIPWPELKAEIDRRTALIGARKALLLYDRWTLPLYQEKYPWQVDEILAQRAEFQANHDRLIAAAPADPEPFASFDEIEPSDDELWAEMEPTLNPPTEQPDAPKVVGVWRRFVAWLTGKH